MHIFILKSNHHLQKKLDSATCNKILIDNEEIGCFSKILTPIKTCLKNHWSRFAQLLKSAWTKIFGNSTQEPSIAKEILKIVWKSLKNTLKPFFAFQDLARDIFLVLKVAIALGGLGTILDNSSTFPSVVS